MIGSRSGTRSGLIGAFGTTVGCLSYLAADVFVRTRLEALRQHLSLSPQGRRHFSPFSTLAAYTGGDHVKPSPGVLHTNAEQTEHGSLFHLSPISSLKDPPRSPFSFVATSLEETCGVETANIGHRNDPDSTEGHVLMLAHSELLRRQSLRRVFSSGRIFSALYYSHVRTVATGPLLETANKESLVGHLRINRTIWL